MRARYFVNGLKGIVAGVAVVVVTSMMTGSVSAKTLQPHDSNRFGQAGQSVRLDLGAPAPSRGGMVLQPVDVDVPLTTRSLAIPAFSAQTGMSTVPYLSAAAGPAQQTGFAGDDSWSVWPGDDSALARHMAVHEPQRVISAADSWWLLLVGIMLVTYQLRRKHIFLRPKPFGF